MDEVLLYYNPMSRARIAHWMLEEVGAPYKLELVRFDKREHKAQSYLAVNPMGKLPAIVHRGVVVTETAAICARDCGGPSLARACGGSGSRPRRWRSPG